MANRDRRKIELCPFNGNIPCKTATLVMNLTRSLRSNDGWMRARANWIKFGRAKYAVVEACETCAYIPQPVEKPDGLEALVL